MLVLFGLVFYLTLGSVRILLGLDSGSPGAEGVIILFFPPFLIFLVFIGHWIFRAPWILQAFRIARKIILVLLALGITLSMLWIFIENLMNIYRILRDLKVG